MLHLLTALVLLQAPTQEKGETVSFRILDKNTLSGFQEPQERFITTLDEWIQLWARRQANRPTKKPHLPVDFDREAVIVVTLGMKTTGGYAIEIVRIVKTKEEIQIFLRKTAPAEGTKPVVAALSPFVLARMPKPDRAVRFYEEPK